MIDAVNRHVVIRTRNAGDVFGIKLKLTVDARTADEKTKDIIVSGVDVFTIFFGSKNVFELDNIGGGRKEKLDTGSILDVTAGELLEVIVRLISGECIALAVAVIGAVCVGDVTGGKNNAALDTDRFHAVGKRAESRRVS